jgi:hypothetical protein
LTLKIESACKDPTLAISVSATATASVEARHATGTQVTNIPYTVVQPYTDACVVTYDVTFPSAL